MRKIIKKILKEDLDDFDWIRNIEVETDLTPAQIKMKYGTFPKEVVIKFITSNFNDLYLEGDKIILRVNEWSEFADLFEDHDGGYGYVNRYLAKAVLAEDDYWEPYYDVIDDWIRDVWGIVTENEELLVYIKNHIKKNFVIPNEYSPNQLDLFTGETPKQKDVYKINGRVLDEDFFNEIISDNEYLGKLIDDEPIFDDLRVELSWAYESCYNDVARNNVWKSVHGAITDLFGKSEWESFENSRGHTEHMLKFDVTDLVLNTVEEEIDYCLDYCKNWFDPEKDYDEDEFDSEDEAFMSFCEECENTPFDDYGYFLDFYAYFLSERYDELSPRYSEWPDIDEVAECFPEDVYSRF